MGKRIASMVGKKLAVLLAETGLKPDAVLISTERYATGEDGSVSQGVVSLDGSEGLSVQFARCCQPIPGDRIVGYLGRGEGLTVHTEDCPTGKRLLARDGERFLQVEWADEPTRPFDTTVVVTVTNGKGVLARVASAIASAEADITHVDMGDEPAQTTRSPTRAFSRARATGDTQLISPRALSASSTPSMVTVVSLPSSSA